MIYQTEGPAHSSFCANQVFIPKWDNFTVIAEISGFTGGDVADLWGNGKLESSK